jgi:hypothetical protein
MNNHIKNPLSNKIFLEDMLLCKKNLYHIKLLSKFLGSKALTLFDLAFIPL